MMDLIDLQRKVELMRSYDLDNPYHMDDFYENIFKPVSKAIAEKQKTTQP
ncbi:MAG: hypothetical protein FWD66_10830 [Paludibacter sp.]|nr:hypothetical protein [Paludibacter sp.]